MFREEWKKTRTSNVLGTEISAGGETFLKLLLAIACREPPKLRKVIGRFFSRKHSGMLSNTYLLQRGVGLHENASSPNLPHLVPSFLIRH